MVVTVCSSVSVDYKSTQIICKVSTIKGTSKLEDTHVRDTTDNVMCSSMTDTTHTGVSTGQHQPI